MAAKQRRRNREEEAEVEVTKRIVVTLAAPGHLAVAAVALLEHLHRVPDLPKAQGLVAEAADGGIQEGNPTAVFQRQFFWEILRQVLFQLKTGMSRLLAGEMSKTI